MPWHGAKIYGEVCGYGATCDAYHITAPSPDAEGARSMTLAMEEVAMNPVKPCTSTLTAPR